MCIFQMFYSSSSFVLWIGASIVDHAPPVPDPFSLSIQLIYENVLWKIYPGHPSTATTALATTSFPQVQIHLFNLNLPNNTRRIPNHDIYRQVVSSIPRLCYIHILHPHPLLASHTDLV